MALYELEAEKKDYLYFPHRNMLPSNLHFHSNVEFAFVEEGVCHITVDGEKRTLKVGEAMFCDSFSPHLYSPEEGSFGYVLLIPKQIADRAFSAFKGKVPPTFFKFEEYDILRKLHDIHELTYESHLANTLKIEGIVEILISAIAEKVGLVERIRNTQSQTVCEILKYASNNLEKPLTLDVLSKEFGYSREHISRLLNKYLPENWNTCINRLRVKKAYVLLKDNPDANVLDIALDCGFESANTFYRAYKKEFGVSPKS